MEALFPVLFWIFVVTAILRIVAAKLRRSRTTVSMLGAISAIALIGAIVTAIKTTPSSSDTKKSSSDTNASGATPTDSPKIIAHGVDGEYDLVVGQSHHVVEATTVEFDANAMIHAREGKQESFTQSPADVINELYAKDTYLHYGNKNEPTMPECVVVDQDPVDVDTSDSGLLNGIAPSSSVACRTDDGTTLYVTAWEK